MREGEGLEGSFGAGAERAHGACHAASASKRCGIGEEGGGARNRNVRGARVLHGIQQHARERVREGGLAAPVRHEVEHRAHRAVRDGHVVPEQGLAPQQCGAGLRLVVRTLGGMVVRPVHATSIAGSSAAPSSSR